MAPCRMEVGHTNPRETLQARFSRCGWGSPSGIPRWEIHVAKFNLDNSERPGLMKKRSRPVGPAVPRKRSRDTAFQFPRRQQRGPGIARGGRGGSSGGGRAGPPAAVLTQIILSVQGTVRSVRAGRLIYQPSLRFAFLVGSSPRQAAGKQGPGGRMAPRLARANRHHPRLRPPRSIGRPPRSRDSEADGLGSSETWGQIHRLQTTCSAGSSLYAANLFWQTREHCEHGKRLRTDEPPRDKIFCPVRQRAAVRSTRSRAGTHARGSRPSGVYWAASTHGVHPIYFAVRPASKSAARPKGAVESTSHGRRLGPLPMRIRLTSPTGLDGPR